ncbi:type I secretion system permease/ATPase [Pseudoxanthomonas sp. Soil82]|uniref:type I secretion system permease/ATPase n=1 Tax=Pseudoxanthomonas sp. Soil82 TaxID=3157341 RepID=UPI00338F6643
MNVAHALPPATPVDAAIPDLAPWVDAILRVAAHYRIDCSREAIRIASAWNGRQAGTEAGIERAVAALARQAGLAVRWVAADAAQLTSWRLPVVVELRGGQVGVITAAGGEGWTLAFSGDAGLDSHLPTGSLQSSIRRMAVMRPLRSAPDSRVDDYLKPFAPDWLRSLVLSDLRPYGHVLLASLVANAMALAGVLFSMQVYDRVIPAQSHPTLYVLFGGVMLATVFAWVMRQARTRIIEVLGKRADLRISDRVFGHAMRVTNAARPKATGTFISQLRELEQVRDMMTSTTVAAIADLPFFVLFCLVFGFIAGGLVWIPVAAMVAMVVPGLLVQKRLRALAQAGMREGALRNAMLVEVVQGVEDIKLLQAEPRFQQQWNHYNLVAADSGMRLRDLVGTLNNWSQTVQAVVFAVVVCVGAPMVMAGDMTTGVLVAASILAGRMLAPLASVTQLLNRWQQAKVAKESLDALLQLPVDAPEHGQRIQRPVLHGDYALREAAFSHDGEATALEVDSLAIARGEKIAVLGRNGAGKSTLLRALSGMMMPATGQVLLDGASLAHLDPGDVRRDVGFLAQEARLFHGTLRENLQLGAPSATDRELEHALRTAQAWDFVQGLAAGLDHRILEGGLGLSGGQRQGLLLARTLLRQPRVLLLDEPTASLDEAAEQHVIRTLGSMTPDTTLVVATHRRPVLQLVDRVIVVDRGRIVADGPRDEVLKRLSQAATQSPATKGTGA